MHLMDIKERAVFIMAKTQRTQGETIAKALKFVAIGAIILAFAFIYYPRSFAGVAGIQDVTADDITQIELTMTVYEENYSSGRAPRTETIAGNKIITDEEFFADVLGVLEDQTMRRRLFVPRVEYRQPDYTTPRYTVLNIRFADDEKLFVHISSDPRFILMWPGGSDPTHYRLYGEGIDTNRLLESVLRLDLTKDSVSISAPCW